MDASPVFNTLNVVIDTPLINLVACPTGEQTGTGVFSS